MNEIHESFKIDPKYMNALVDLVNQCREEKVEIREFGTLNNGLFVKFKDIPGDAVIHDFSYGNKLGNFETYKMPWDYDDVSVHEPKELGRMLGALIRGEDWENLPPEKKGRHEKSYQYEWE